MKLLFQQKMSEQPIYSILHPTYFSEIFTHLNLVEIKRILRLNKDFHKLRNHPTILNLCTQKFQVIQIKTDNFWNTVQKDYFNTREKALQNLVYDSDVEVLDEMIRRNIFSSLSSYIILQTCINYRKFNMLKYVIEDPNMDLTMKSYFVLMQVCEFGTVPLVQLLLDDTRLKHVKDDESIMNSAFHTACLGNNVSVCHFFLGNNFVKSPTHLTESLISAAFCGKTDVVEFLLKDGRADPTHADYRCLREACQNGHIGPVRLLLKDARVDPNFYHTNSFKHYVSGNYLKVLDAFLDQDRFNPGQDDNYLIQTVLRSKNSSLFKRLLEDPRVDPSANKNYCIRKVKEIGWSGTIRLLMKDKRVLNGLTEKEIEYYRRM